MITCCKNCVPPKRYPGCHDHCPEYQEQKVIHDKEKEEQNKLNALNAGLYKQRENAIAKVTHNSRKSASFQTKTSK